MKTIPSGPTQAEKRHRAAQLETFLISDVYPAVDDGRYPVKGGVARPFEVWADILKDGHDVFGADLLWRRAIDKSWKREPMSHHSNDRWHGAFIPLEAGRYFYAIEAWTDEFATWRRDTIAKRDDGQDVTLEALEGAAMLTKSTPSDRHSAELLLSVCDAFLRDGNCIGLLKTEVVSAMANSQFRLDATRSRSYPLIIERNRAQTSAWYGMMPRSQGSKSGVHGTFHDCIARLPDVAEMGFDVLYLTPIHPIGNSNRKGRNNSLTASPADPGSPYAIGSSAGGHDAVHPELGSLEDFRSLVAAAKRFEIEIALDFAVQCSPNHPWLKEHPEWFRRRPDGTIRYAENPPKKYQDIHNPDFSSDESQELWVALRDVVLFWVAQGVKIFRVDNPHTKPFPFWQWLILDIQTRDPDVVFLAEAFTRPKLMKALAKLGFSQSYTYFTWRTEKWELEQYLRELISYPEREYYRPNFFVSTPDILPIHLQSGEPWIFKCRLALAATLSSNYGIYNGFELLEHAALPGKEEYLDSDKYEIKTRNWDAPGNIKSYIRDINAVKKANASLQQTSRLTFLNVEDPNVLAYFKFTPNSDNVVLCAVSLTRDARDIWLPCGSIDVLTNKGLAKTVALENAKSGERVAVEWGGVRVRMDPQRDPALLFRCLA